MTTALTVAADAVTALQTTTDQVQHQIETSTGLAKTIAIATGLVAIADAMTPEMISVLTHLQGHDVGFKTDKDSKGGYPAEVVKQCAVRAFLHGAQLHGNEFNIIASSCYLTQGFFLRKLKEIPAISDIVIEPHKPTAERRIDKNIQYTCSGYASCKIGGKLVEVHCREDDRGDSRIVVSAYDNSTALDGALGKVKKRLAQRLYERVAGVTITEEEISPADIIDVTDKSKPPAEAEPTTTRESSEESTANTTIDWKAEFKRYGVSEQAEMLRDAPNQAEREGVLDVAREQLAEGNIDQRGMDILQRYADHKASLETA